MQITGNTRIVGILGDPVSHSLSPQMQNAAFAHMGLDICYVPLHVRGENLTAAVKGLVALDFIGANVTIPHKVAIIDLVHELAESARLAGAINTLVIENGSVTGHNTDGEGFIRSLEEVITVNYRQTPVFMAGAGGAARGIAVALAQKGIPSLILLNRTRSRAEALQSFLSQDFPGLEVLVRTPEEDYGDLLTRSRLVVNATTVGMEGRLKRPPLNVDKLSEEHVVCDIVYTRSQETPFLVAARKKGAKTLGGTGMLLHQGAVAIHLWTGAEPPIDIMRQAIES